MKPLNDAAQTTVAMLGELTDYDPEIAHRQAEDLIYVFLASAGFKEVADAFIKARNRVGFWYG